MMLKTSRTLLLATTLLPTLLTAVPVTLVKDGKPAATIVVQAKPSNPLNQAAQDLQTYIRKLSGVTLPLQKDGKAVNGTGLYIGNCEPTPAALIPGTDTGLETYKITANNRGVFFTGRNPTPSAYAVFSFLEDDLGIRWFAPGDEWELLPKTTPGELTVDIRNRTVTPGTSPRIWSGHGWASSWNVWNLRNKTTLSEVVSKRNFQNRIYTIFPPDKYAKDHPEYYPLCNGKRYIPQKGDPYWRPCEGNPEVQKIVVDTICDFFDKHPDIDSYSIGMDDVTHLCSCPLCLAMDATPDDYRKQAFSQRHYAFVNIIAKEVAKRHPDKYVGTLIYQIALTPPPKIDKLEPNVFGYITETSAFWWNPGQKEFDNALTEEWCRRVKHLSRYDYYGFASMTPRYYPHYVDQQMKFDKQHGFEGMYIEVYTFLPLTMPMIWLTAKLQWDASLNADALLDDFMNIYGDAKPVMTRFWDLMEQTYLVARPGRGKWEHRNIQNQAYASSPEDLDKLFALLDEADRATTDATVHARIACHRDALKLSEYAIRPFTLCNRMADLEVTSQADVDTIFAASKKLAEMTAGREAYLKQLAARKDLLGLNFNGLVNQKGYLQINAFSELEANFTAALFNAIKWTIEHNPQALDGIIDVLKASTAEIYVNALAYACTFRNNAKPKNLLLNGDFNATATEAANPEIPLDWDTKGLPPGWNSWANAAGMKVGIIQNGFDGPAAYLANSIGNGCLISRTPVTPGDRMLITLKMRGEGDGNAKLGVRFMTSKGAWANRTSDISINFTAAALKDWRDVTLSVKVPDDGGILVLMPGASNQHSEKDKVFFDSVQLIKLEQ